VPKEEKVSSVKPRLSRRDLMVGSAALAGSLAMRGAELPVVSPQPGEDFGGYQQRRPRTVESARRPALESPARASATGAQGEA